MSKNKSFDIHRDGYVFPFVSAVFSWLSRHTFSYLLRNLLVKKIKILSMNGFGASRVIPDTYVLVGVCFSSVLAYLSSNKSIANIRLFAIIAVGACIYRGIEMLIVLLNNFFFVQYDKRTPDDFKIISSARRSIFLLFLNLIEVVNTFIVISCNYAYNYGNIAQTSYGTWLKGTVYCLLNFEQDSLKKYLSCLATSLF